MEKQIGQMINISDTLYELMIGVYDRNLFISPYNKMIADEMEAGGIVESSVSIIYNNCNHIADLYGIEEELSEELLNRTFCLLKDVCITSCVLGFLGAEDITISKQRRTSVLTETAVKKNKYYTELRNYYDMLLSIEKNDKTLLHGISNAIIDLFQILPDKIYKYGKKIGKTRIIWIKEEYVIEESLKHIIRNTLIKICIDMINMSQILSTYKYDRLYKKDVTYAGYRRMRYYGRLSKNGKIIKISSTSYYDFRKKLDSQYIDLDIDMELAIALEKDCRDLMQQKISENT